jgi:hypothetical protein
LDKKNNVISPWTTASLLSDSEVRRLVHTVIIPFSTGKHPFNRCGTVVADMSTVLGAVTACCHDLGPNTRENGSLVPVPLKSVADEEETARKKAASNALYLLLVNGYSAIFIFIFHLVSLEGLVSIGLSIGLTVYTYLRTEGNDSFNGSSMTWVLLSFAVITPIGAALRMTFTRRELALQQTATLRSTFLQLYTSHAIWDWGFTAGNELESGRTKVSLC